MPWFAATATGVGNQLLADDNGERLTKGDAALLRFAAAAEILETDFWVQYNELGGIPDREVPGGSGILLILPSCKTSTATFRNTSTTTPMTRSVTVHF